LPSGLSVSEFVFTAKPEDARYAAWRALWSTRGQLYFIIRSYLQINLLQGAIILIVASPLVVSLTQLSVTTAQFPFLIYSVPLGILIFATGLIIETVADWQLDNFIAGKRAGTETAPLMTRGLFHYCRRPNYFGESLIWWGLSICVLPLPYGYLALISPLVITYIVTHVTGPMLEKIFLEKYPVEYAAYMATTSYFIPWPPRTK
jgi:steroid 5-alpha reductase family enzyme